MNMRKIIISISVILSTMLLLTACGGGDKPGIAIGPPASGTNSFSKHLFAAYDLEEDDYTEFQEGFSDAADGVQDGNIELLLGILGLPAGSIESLQASVDELKCLASQMMPLTTLKSILDMNALLFQKTHMISLMKTLIQLQLMRSW